MYKKIHIFLYCNMLKYLQLKCVRFSQHHIWKYNLETEEEEKLNSNELEPLLYTMMIELCPHAVLGKC